MIALIYSMAIATNVFVGHAWRWADGPACNAQAAIESEVVAALLRCEAEHLLFPEYRWVLVSDITKGGDPQDLAVRGGTSFARAKGGRLRYAQPSDIKQFSRREHDTMILTIHVKRELQRITGYFGGIGLGRDGYLNVVGGVQDPIAIVRTVDGWRCERPTSALTVRF